MSEEKHSTPGEAHLWVSLRETPCVRVPSSVHSRENREPIARTAFVAYGRELRTRLCALIAGHDRLAAR